jgi:hypothetical protein
MDTQELTIVVLQIDDIPTRHVRPLIDIVSCPYTASEIDKCPLTSVSLPVHKLDPMKRVDRRDPLEPPNTAPIALIVLPKTAERVADIPEPKSPKPRVEKEVPTYWDLLTEKSDRPTADDVTLNDPPIYPEQAIERMDPQYVQSNIETVIPKDPESFTEQDELTTIVSAMEQAPSPTISE